MGYGLQCLRDTVYLAAGDGFAWQQLVTAVIWIVGILQIRIGEIVIYEMNCDRNMQNYGYSVKISRNTNIPKSIQIIA